MVRLTAGMYGQPASIEFNCDECDQSATTACENENMRRITSMKLRNIARKKTFLQELYENSMQAMIVFSWKVNQIKRPRQKLRPRQIRIKNKLMYKIFGESVNKNLHFPL